MNKKKKEKYWIYPVEIQVVMKDLEKTNQEPVQAAPCCRCCAGQPAAAAAGTAGLRSDLTDRTCSELEANICVSHVVKCLTEQ